MTEQNEITLPAEGLTTSKVAAAYLNISESMWNKLRKNGQVKEPVRLGVSVRWEVSYLRELATNGIPAA